MARTRSAELHIQLAQAERLYIEEPIALSLEDIAQQCHIALGTLKQCSTENDWVKRRERFQMQLREEHTKQALPVALSSLQALRERMHTLLETMLTQFEEQLSNGQLKFKNAEEAIRAISALAKEVSALTMLAPPDAHTAATITTTNVKTTTVLRELIKVQNVQTPIEPRTVEGAFKDASTS